MITLHFYRIGIDYDDEGELFVSEIEHDPEELQEKIHVCSEN